MDERIFPADVGYPIPAWDLMHRLPISGDTGPIFKDDATVYKLNSTWMDVSGQPHMARHSLAVVCLVGCFFIAVLLIFLISACVLNSHRGWDFDSALLIVVIVSGICIYSYYVVKYGRDEFFSLTHRPIRFHREQKKIYAIRRRRFRRAKELGDITWEIPWSEQTVFCAHRCIEADESMTFHIRCYQLDAHGKVARSMDVGREWHGVEGMHDLLSQWNYWCRYMNHGPAELPQPLMFLSEHESLHESYRYCMYDRGFGLSFGMKAFLFPFAVPMTICRIIALATCRAPIWPPEIALLSEAVADDPYAQPHGTSLVGWVATAQAIAQKRYAGVQHGTTPCWLGEEDSLKHAARWVTDDDPRTKKVSRKTPRPTRQKHT